MKIRVADYLTEKLYKAGGKNVFLITGGMIMHLTDALQQHKQQTYTCCHHEQSAVMAADSYGRLTGRIGVAYVTAGPGALNTLNSVVGAYVDTSPVVIVAGQSKVSQAKVKGPRQFALQGFNTLPILKQVTKYAVMLDDITRVKYEIEKCIHIAKAHRVGPVWIEVPIDIQGTWFNPDEYKGYVPDYDETADLTPSEELVKKAADYLRNSLRPCILAGAGIRLSNAIKTIHKFAEKVNIPVVTSRLGMDLIGYDHPLFVGRPGTYGDRAANFTIQNSDFLLTIGCRLGIGLVGYDFQDFASHAKKVVVDVDEAELNKPSVIPDIPIKGDAKIFLEMFGVELGDYRCNNQLWVDKTQYWKKHYIVNLPEYADEKDGINSYHFITKLSEKVSDDAVFLLDTGSCFHVHAQAFKVKFGQRHIITGGLSTMGYSPASIGCSVANDGKDVFCISGDGSFQFNIQELQTIVHNQLPIKIIIFNNQGYLLIRITQNNFQERRYIGESPGSGVSFPNLEKISDAYGIKFIRITRLNELNDKLAELICYKGAVLCEVMTPREQLLIPRVASKQLEDGTMISMPYDNMFPFLPEEEYSSNCVRNTLK